MSAVIFDIEAHRAKRNRQLERENSYLRAERNRLERLLADALLVAVGGTRYSTAGVPSRNVQPLALLDLLAEMQGTSTARAAYLEHRERVATEALIERTVKVLQETAAP